MEVGVWEIFFLNWLKCYHITMHISFWILVRKEGIILKCSYEDTCPKGHWKHNKFVMKPFDTICKHCVLVSSCGIYVKSLSFYGLLTFVWQLLALYKKCSAICLFQHQHIDHSIESRSENAIASPQPNISSSGGLGEIGQEHHCFEREGLT